MTAMLPAALLPTGLSDMLAPEAEHEARIGGRLLKTLAASGYERVKPPLVEFEDTLLSGPGAAMAQHTFRLMDPVSQRIMGLRADMTPQIARIAASRLAHRARPLRLSYMGEVLRVRGGQLRPERQVTQVGAELIGADSALADAEAAQLAIAALAGVGIAELSLDLTLPTLVPALAAALGLEDAALAALRAALDRKDPASVDEAAGTHAAPFHALMAATGPVAEALPRLRALALPPGVAPQRARLESVLEALAAMGCLAAISIDPVESRGFEYQSGVSFTALSGRVRGELGRGGRYLAPAPDGSLMPATGFSLYLDSILRGLPTAEAPRRILVPALLSPARLVDLQSQGWTTVRSSDATVASPEEARRLRCSHIASGDTVAPVS